MEPVPNLDELRVIRRIDPDPALERARFQAWTMNALDTAAALPIEEPATGMRRLCTPGTNLILVVP